MFYCLSEDGGEGVAQQPGERALVVVQLTPNPGLGSRLVIGEGQHGSRTPRVEVSLVLTQSPFNQLWTLIEVQVKPLVLEEEALVAEPARREFRSKADVGDVSPRLST